MLRTAKPDTQLPVTPLLLDYLRQLRIKLAVAALFLQTDTQHFPGAELAHTHRQFVVLCLSQRLFFTVALRQPHILTPAAILTAVTEAGCGLTAEFRLTRESPDIHTIQGGNILTCGGKRSQL
ncbi:hypothetical protein HmCmsJML008_04931 [Escherichia coli]|nr:hypothetical protein HmCmsJML008_04931 [Escherichia coli]GCT97438.1 hypothetical protein HmCms159_04976 [Escherichia coli]GCU71416.1 hypothetical protein HmCmsJML027_04704 [Escherichia coli]GCV40717.1 hypothetical protein HmCmsJML054_04911 [Escherichia coli]